MARCFPLCSGRKEFGEDHDVENSLLWMCSSPFPFTTLSPNKGDGEGSTDCNNQVRVLWQAGAVVTRLDVFLRMGSG